MIKPPRRDSDRPRASVVASGSIAKPGPQTNVHCIDFLSKPPLGNRSKPDRSENPVGNRLDVRSCREPPFDEWVRRPNGP